jgi:ankyrin repeat protein
MYEQTLSTVAEARIFPRYEGSAPMSDEVPAPPTRLLAALLTGDRDTALALAVEGADVNVADDRPLLGAGATPLHHAAGANDADLVQALLTAGATVDARTHAGHTPLWWACNSGATETARQLLVAGADANARCREGYSPLGRVRASDPALMELLRSHGAVI